MEHGSVHELTAAYVLDALAAEEAREYEQHLALCSRCREELASMSETAATLAFGVEAPAPPPALRERILEAARAESNVVPLRRRWALPATGAVAAVAACVALGLGIWSASLSNSLADAREAIAVVSDPEATVVGLRGARGRLVVAKDGRAALVLARLDRPPSGKTYEAWVIRPGDEPAPAGLFTGGDDPVVVELTRPVPERATVAVTLEREGGVQAPTSPPLFTARA